MIPAGKFKDILQQERIEKLEAKLAAERARRILAEKRLSVNWHDFVRPHFNGLFEKHLEIFDNRIIELEHYDGDYIVNHMTAIIDKAINSD